MSLPVKFRKTAERDLTGAQRRYERKEPGLGKRFRTYVDEAVERVRAAPERYPYANTRLRRIIVRRPFPYTLYYSRELIYVAV